MPSGKTNVSGFAERGGGEPAALFLPDDWRVEALFDRRPDAECGCEPEPADRQVATVADTDFVDAAEEVITRVAGEHIGEPRLDAHPAQGQLSPLDPLRRHGELAVAEHDAGQFVGLVRMRCRHVHRHVEVMATGVEGGVEDRWIEPRVAGIDHDVGANRAGQLDDVDSVGRIDPRGTHSFDTGAISSAAGAIRVDVGQHDLLEHRPPRSDGRERGPDATGADHENPHGPRLARARFVSPIRQYEKARRSAPVLTSAAMRLARYGLK